MLVEERLRPLGVLAQADGSSPAFQKIDPLLALKFRVALVSEAAVNKIAVVFQPVFWPITLAAVIAAIAAVDVWLFFIRGIGQSTRELVYNPLLLSWSSAPSSWRPRSTRSATRPRLGTAVRARA